MEKIELKAYGKINLGLDVIRKRPDGYHDLDMIMQMVDVYDDIVITKNKTGKIEVKTDTAGLSNGKDNLAYMAAKMLMDEFKIKDGVNIYINKRIPIAGGMAGGSSDCATTLMGINQLFELGLSKEELMETAKAMAAKIISKGSYAVSVAKAAINNGYDMDIKNAVEMEANLFGVVNDTHDKKEGMGAFLEKRKADLTDF